MSRRIMIVDDSSTVRNIVLKELHELDCKIITAVSGLDALEKLKTMSVDLIVMDGVMPDMDGYTAYGKLCSEEYACEIGMTFKPPTVIFLTATDNLEDRSKGFALGAADFITKPFSPGELFATVNNILNPENKYKGLSALVAEDSAVIRHLLADILTKEGMSVFQAADGEEALNIYRENVLDIDLIITDMYMPKLSGLELCQMIRQDLNQKNVPIIVLSALTERGRTLEIFKAGATDYLAKPFPKEELLSRIYVHLDVRILNRELGSQLMASKSLGKMRDEFLSVCSHDLRNPLSSIKVMTEMMMKGGLSPEKTLQFYQHINKNSIFLLDTVNELLDLTKFQSGKTEITMEPLSLSESLEICLPLLQSWSSAKGIDFQVEDKSTDAMRISGNLNAIIRIINNLASNALKFTAKEGKVRLVLEPCEDQKLAIIISDTGIGIPRGKVSSMFKKFSKASRPGTEGEKGTGLGLSISRELIEKHGGTIQLESEEGRGTIVKVFFPLLGNVTKESGVCPKICVNDPRGKL